MLIIAILEAIGGLVLLFASSWLLSLVPGATQVFSAPVVEVTPKVFAIVALFGAILAYAAARDPVRNVAIIDAFIFLLLAAVALDIYASWIVHMSLFLAGRLAIVRIVVRLALAIALIVLRPRGAPAQSY